MALPSAMSPLRSELRVEDGDPFSFFLFCSTFPSAFGLEPLIRSLPIDKPIFFLYVLEFNRLSKKFTKE